MNKDRQQTWTNEVLDLIFEALASHENLKAILVFKGARVLYRRLGTASRQSYDIDANLSLPFVQATPDREEQRSTIEREFSAAIRAYFESQAVVRFELARVSVRANPRDDHPLGWNAFTARINVGDRSNSGILGLPALEIDVAAPEVLERTSTQPLMVGTHIVTAYSLSRVAGEKCRAFLSSLPANRAKLQRPGGVVRAKDLYDLHEIATTFSITNKVFWAEAGREFRAACESRFIDCVGLETFEEQLEVTAATYRNEANIPKAVPFAEAWKTLDVIVRFFERTGVVPFAFPLPIAASLRARRPLGDLS